MPLFVFCIPWFTLLIVMFPVRLTVASVMFSQIFILLNSNQTIRFNQQSCGFVDRRRVIQVYERGARILDGSFMTQDVSFGASNSESNYGSESALALSVSIADPYVLLRMSDGSVRLLVGGKFLLVTSVKINYSYLFY
jgi:hypothetical protein